MKPPRVARASLPAGLALLAGPAREEQLKDAFVAGLAEHRSADGGYRLRNAFHGLIARAG